MVEDLMIISAELGKDYCTSQLVGTESVLSEVNMQALDVTDLLIMPSGGVVDQPGTVDFKDILHDLLRIELSPALVKGNPHSDTRAVV